MASDSERYQAHEPVVEGDDRTVGDEEWPIADLYHVEPVRGFSGDRLTDETIVRGSLKDPASPRRPRSAIGPVVLAIAVAASAVILAAILLGSRDEAQPAPASRKTTTTLAAAAPPAAAQAASPVKTVPKVMGMTVADARRVLEDLGLRSRVTTARSERTPGLVLRQEPSQGTGVGRGGVIALVVSSGAASDAVTTVAVPSVVGLSASDAVDAIRDAGFVAKIRLVAPTERGGVVVRQSPAGDAQAPRGRTVRLDVSRIRALPPRIDMPDLVGWNAVDARHRLESLGLDVEVIRVASTQPPGTVLRQSPRAGSRLPASDAVTLTVSSGQQGIDVPDVGGLDEESARAELESAGFAVDVAYESTTDPARDGLVDRQAPVGGSTASAGSVVTIVVARLG